MTEESGYNVPCMNCKGTSTPTCGFHRTNRCEDCNGTHYVDEFYWQGKGQAPEGWKGNVVEPSGND